MGKQILIGFIMGLIANAVGVFLYTYFVLQMPIEEALPFAYENDRLGSIIALGGIADLLLFFFYLGGDFKVARKPAQPYLARGVLLATILLAIAVLFLTMDSII